MKTIRTVLVAVFVSLVAAVAIAQPQAPEGADCRMPPPPPDGAERRMPPPPGPPPLEMIVIEHADELGLTDAQVQQIKNVADSARAEMEALHRAVFEAFQGGEREDFLAAERALRERQATLAATVLAVLTDEQWHALQQLLPPPPPPPPAPPER